ncbi:hypothetical protein ACQ4PT_035897 [Festuca glaucescens]
MEAPISASLGAMGSLIGKLYEIVAAEHRVEILKLREDLEITRSLLLKLSKARDPPVTARHWMKHVRELSYDMEDCVDAEPDWIDEKMSGFKTRAAELNEQYHRYMLEDSVPSFADIAIDHRLPAVDGRNVVVGIDANGGPIDRLCQLLSDQDPELKVVSIVGVAGIGKTTIAEQLWHKLGAFQCRAFVQTSKKPDMRGILRSILSQVRPHQPPPGVSDVHNLTQDIYDHLQDKSYFVIIDDLWATSVWEVVSRAFPEGNHGSRIITTTETEDVALASCAYQSSAHMVHDFITSKSIEQNFVTVMDYSESTIQLSDKVRRLSLQFGSATYATTPASTRLSQVRSLTFIGLLKCMPSISEFKLLRVLILNFWGDQGSTSFDLAQISELFLLRYLQIICNIIVQVPDQMQGLEHLETLEINARPDWSLLHLVLGAGLNRPHATLDPSAPSTSISSSEPRYTSDPVKAFELVPPIWSLPNWIGQLNKLCTLKVVVRELQQDDISGLGGLPALTVLSLYVRRHTAEIFVFNTAQFAALEYFEFKCGVLRLTFQEGAMPNLQMLKLGFNAQYGNFLAGIQHLSNLKEVAGIIGVADCAEEPEWRAAESAFKDAIQLANEVNVKRADLIEDEYDSPENRHFIQEKHPPSEQPGNIKEESDRRYEA